MDILAFNNLLSGLFQGIGQNGGQPMGPVINPPIDPTMTAHQPDGITYKEGPASPAMQDQINQYHLANLENALNGLDQPAVIQNPQPPPLEPNIQSELQPQGLVEPSYQAPTESTPVPSNLEVTQPPPTSDSGSDSSTPTYDTITKELLAELQSGKKKNWGEALGLAAIAFSNPQLAIGLMQASERDRQQLKAMLLQAGGQEMSLKRAEQTNISAEKRQAERDAAAQARQDARLEEARMDPIRREAAEVNFDVEAYRKEDGTYDMPKLNSELGKAKTEFKQQDSYYKMLADSRGKGIDVSDLEKYTPENFQELLARSSAYNKQQLERQSRIDEYKERNAKLALDLQGQRVNIAQQALDRGKDADASLASYREALAKATETRNKGDIVMARVRGREILAKLQDKYAAQKASSSIPDELGVVAGQQAMETDRLIRSVEQDLKNLGNILEGKDLNPALSEYQDAIVGYLEDRLSLNPLIPQEYKQNPLAAIAAKQDLAKDPSIQNELIQAGTELDARAMKIDSGWKHGDGFRFLQQRLSQEREAQKPKFNLNVPFVPSINRQNWPIFGGPPPVDLTPLIPPQEPPR